MSIDAGNQLVDRIKPAAASTKRTGSMGALGGFGGLFDLKACGYKDPILVSGTDGVGTKLKFAFQSEKHDTIGIDLVAMCVNDLLVQGAEPLFFLDYFSTGELKIRQAQDVIEGIAAACRESGCQLIGGETAEMPGMYPPGEYDLAGFAIGAVERHQLLPRMDHLQEGDAIIGIASSGLHSNGFSLIHKIMEHKNLKLHDEAPFDEGKSFAESFLTPTKLYIKSCLPAVRSGTIKAMAHITGGGLLENIPRVLPDRLSAEISVGGWSLPHVYRWIASTGLVDAREMLRTFNCGIGMVVIVDASNGPAMLKYFEERGEEAYALGELTSRGSQAVNIIGELF
ncbi:MAG: phosphoribosylformylglycinamidine cyclo-ligase [Rickettsiales bacterium]|nr:phosphoribosylformylglycinamidine cyclo-ligase [Rickettsiales bacterium]